MSALLLRGGPRSGNPVRPSARRDMSMSNPDPGPDTILDCLIVVATGHAAIAATAIHNRIIAG